MGYFITLIAKYYYSNSLSLEALVDIVQEKILTFRLEGYQEYKYHSRIVAICKSIIDGDIRLTFREDDYVPIYKSEIELIDTLPNDRQKKLMFTFFVIARYMNCDGWINKKTVKDISEVFKLANVSLTISERSKILYELYTNGYISFGKKVDNLNIRVPLDKEEDPTQIIYKVVDFHNLGNQYIGNFKKGYGMCQNCGKQIRLTNNKRKYCKSCAELLNKNDTRKRMELARNSEKP